MKAKRKVKRPSDFKNKNINSNRYLDIFCASNFITVVFTGMQVGDIQLSDAKRLHKWLGRAIKYMEQEEK